MSLDNIVVEASPLTNTLRVGRLNKSRKAFLEWEDREDEIINAVRDFMYNEAIKQNTDCIACVWNRFDGKKVKLSLAIDKNEMCKNNNYENMNWKVYRNTLSSDEINVFNVFDHKNFFNDVVKILESDCNYDEFQKRLHRECVYYYMSKCEHELVVTSFPPYVDKEEIDRLTELEVNYRANVHLTVGRKIDIFQQLKLNWEQFCQYVYGFRSQ